MGSAAISVLDPTQQTAVRRLYHGAPASPLMGWHARAAFRLRTMLFRVLNRVRT